MKAKLRLNDFVEFTNTDGKLIKAVKCQTGKDWEGFQDLLRNIAAYTRGEVGGFRGFILTSRDVEFWRQNRKIITECLNDLAFSLGENTLQMVMKFGGIKDGDFSEDEVRHALYGPYNSDLDWICNVLAKFALEEVANWYSDFEKENS